MRPFSDKFQPSTLYAEGMRLVVTHISALEITRICGASFINSRASIKNPRSITTAAPIFSPSELVEHPILRQLPRPISVLNNSNTHRMHTLDIRYRQWAHDKLKLIDLGGGLCIPNPEELFLQAAVSLSTVQLTCLGLEICGTYEIARQTDRTPIDKLASLTNTQKLSKAISSAEGVRGTPAARKALPLLADRSASHMETATFLRLTLPYSKGGFNLPKPLMNQRISLTKEQCYDERKAYLVCDMFWPEHRLAVEYDSDLHANPLKIGRDASRKNALLDLGIDVITVTKMQMFNMSEFNKAAKAIGRKLEVRHQPRCANYESRQAELVRELLRR